MSPKCSCNVLLLLLGCKRWCVCTRLCVTNWRNWDGCRFYYSQTVVIVLVGLCDNVMTRPKVISDWLSSWDFHILPSWNGKFALEHLWFWFWKRLWRASIEMEFKIPPYGIKLLKTVQYYFYFDCGSHKPKMLSQMIWIYLWFCLWTDLQWLFICSHCSSGQMNVVFDYSVCLHVLIYMIRSQSSPFPVYLSPLCHLQAFPTAVGFP